MYEDGEKTVVCMAVQFLTLLSRIGSGSGQPRGVLARGDGGPAEIPAVRLARYTPGMDVAALAATTVLDAEGREVRTGDLWADQATVAVWLRHFG